MLSRLPRSAGILKRYICTSQPLKQTWHDLPDLSQLPRAKTVPQQAPIVNPADQYKEYSEELHKFGKYIMSCMPKYIQQFSVWKDELTLYVAPSALRPTAIFLKNHTPAQFKSVMDVTAVDYPSRENRFEVVYNFLSVRHNCRIRVKTYASETSPVPSLVPLYEGVNWFERETYDMFGVFFEGHPDLRRIMTDYGFEGYPLRKDFPTTGYVEVRYDEEKKRIVYEPLELTQAFRNFSVGSSVWEQVGEGKDFTPESFKLPTPAPEPEKDDDKTKK
ncbi:putative NADH-ubiquinone oxidoreductase 30.4 kDa subunit, mitochondrial [Scheffersomyces spartinae]|uniref:NADH-ubiquinone oxidoreductase 30.4 kDa subunit, mitochondrial n=1 Tax=Scheffersomyces spartinae TaxID=45513 RepID=A0A9P7V6G0_9ASCO|nr:putative NADH-ubiquinone oxidoreductase 30.4 kDa subunit, mitochondrial [Scheffersomyces spartinae]KAG7192096.1 putative NADH-ubiquinone oxidoreductase 30.4 kDa subunit, mitochondrial [Scheffersomyces spartinae]